MAASLTVGDLAALLKTRRDETEAAAQTALSQLLSALLFHRSHQFATWSLDPPLSQLNARKFPTDNSLPWFSGAPPVSFYCRENGTAAAVAFGRQGSRIMPNPCWGIISAMSGLECA